LGTFPASSLAGARRRPYFNAFSRIIFVCGDAGKRTSQLQNEFARLVSCGATRGSIMNVLRQVS
jgi:hypothetical protein